jgi:hypothetical protein
LNGLVDVGGFHDLGDFELLHPRDTLYRRVHPRDVREGLPLRSHCPTKHWRAGLSCDWAVVTPPDEAGVKLPYILLFTVQHCWELEIEVRYCPVIDPTDPHYNLAHCLLFLPPNVLQSKCEVDERRAEFLKGCVLRPWPA